MSDIFLLKHGELILKGLNRARFEAQLIRNIKRRLAPLGEFKIYSMQSTVYVEPLGECDPDAVFAVLSRIFGISALCRARPAPKDMNAILDLAARTIDLSNIKTFKVEARRSDKAFPYNSPQICAAVGERLLETFPNVTVDVHSPEATVYIEVRDVAAYVHREPTAGAGGLPVGTSGRAALLLSGGIDSPVAGYMMAKRGLDLLPVHFHSYPYTSEEALQKTLTLARLMSLYTGRAAVQVVSFTEIQEAIRDNCEERLFTLIMRRFMMRIAERVALDNGCEGLITGESLGQVASQTMLAMAATEAVCALPVMRPLVGMDKTEIVATARKIGTFETSILPFEDCCTVFTPRHPKTRPGIAELEKAESVLDVEALVENAVKNSEKRSS